MSSSQELHDQWQEHGGDLREYEHPREICNERGRVRWFRSGVVRWTNLADSKQHVFREKREPLSEQSSHIRWKHRGSDTWMHLQSGVNIVAGAPVGFKAYVTINGQRLTVGEYFADSDPKAVIEWAIEWMKNHPDGYTDDE